MKKKLSSHRIYEVLSSRLHTFHVAERGEDGKFYIYPLTEEIQSTEWLPGLLVLSPFPLTVRSGESFADLAVRWQQEWEAHPLYSPSPGSEIPLHAYWVFSFSVADMRCLSACGVQLVG